MKNAFQKHVEKYSLREHKQQQIQKILDREAAGEISNVKFNQSFPHLVNGQKLWDLKLDVAFVDSQGNMSAIIYRSYMEGITDVLQLKIKAFEAEYGRPVQVHAI